MKKAVARKPLFDATCRQAGLDLPEMEYLFAPPRKWRFDFCWPNQGKVALEVEGGAYHGPGHRSVNVFLSNMEKYNAATILGWRVLRCTVKEFENGTGLELVMRAVEASKYGTIRFWENAIVQALLDFATPRGFGMNEITIGQFSREDREQFAQLIGYSVSGFGELSYTSRAAVKEADAEVERLLAKRKRK